MEELLAQIRALLDEYLAQGGDTPVAAEAQALAAAIDSATGGTPEAAGPEGEAPPEEPSPEAAGPPPEAMAAMAGGGAPPTPMEEESVPPGDQAPDFATASAGAEEMLKRRKAKA